MADGNCLCQIRTQSRGLHQISPTEVFGSDQAPQTSQAFAFRIPIEEIPNPTISVMACGSKRAHQFNLKGRESPLLHSALRMGGGLNSPISHRDRRRIGFHGFSPIRCCLARAQVGPASLARVHAFLRMPEFLVFRPLAQLDRARPIVASLYGAPLCKMKGC